MTATGSTSTDTVSSVSGAAQGQFSGFATYALQDGPWTLTGETLLVAGARLTTGAVRNDGTIVTDRGTVTANGVVTGSGPVTVEVPAGGFVVAVR